MRTFSILQHRDITYLLLTYFLDKNFYSCIDLFNLIIYNCYKREAVQYLLDEVENLLPGFHLPEGFLPNLYSITLDLSSSHNPVMLCLALILPLCTALRVDLLEMRIKAAASEIVIELSSSSLSDILAPWILSIGTSCMKDLQSITFYHSSDKESKISNLKFAIDIWLYLSYNIPEIKYFLF